MLGAMVMLLQRQFAAGNDDDALDLEALAHVDRLVIAPRPVHALVVGRLGALGGFERVDQLACTSCARARGTTITASDVLTTTMSLTPTTVVSLPSEWSTQSAGVHGNRRPMHDIAGGIALA